MSRLTWVMALGLAATAAQAEGVATEVSQLGKQQVTLHLHPWLAAEEVATLKLVATNEEALQLFVTRPGRHAALAVAPAEGLVRGGQPVASAVAISDLPSVEAARAAALEGCEAARSSGPACAIVLEVAPLQ